MENEKNVHNKNLCKGMEAYLLTTTLVNKGPLFCRKLSISCTCKFCICVYCFFLGCHVRRTISILYNVPVVRLVKGYG